MTSQSHDAPWRPPGQSPEPAPGRPAAARLVDPEDDLTPVGYPGEFGTTGVIPYQDPNQPGSPGYGLLDQQEPLPYVQPQSPARVAPISATEPGRRIKGPTSATTMTASATSAGAAPSTWDC